MANSADAKDEGLVFHPMDQFIVEPLFGAGPVHWYTCLLYTSPSPRDRQKSRMPSSA